MLVSLVCARVLYRVLLWTHAFLLPFFSLLSLLSSAGSRDSALTAHGVLQTRRLGSHLASFVATHIFSSDLQRASATALAILDAQKKSEKGEKGVATEVVKLVDLRERDFRSGEGVRFAGGGGNDKGRNAFADAETRDEMRVRAERFIHTHLYPLLRDMDVDVTDTSEDVNNQRAIVVVAHGLILSVLLLSLLQRHAPSELVRLAPSRQAVAASGSDAAAQRRLAELRVPWSNTGYLVMTVQVNGEKKKEDDEEEEKQGDAGQRAGIQLQVTKVNCVEHLDGLKKTRGGIGSARFDPKQKTMDSFFGPSAKRQKRGDDA